MPQGLQLAMAIQRELLRLASKNQARSAPMLVAACALVVFLGWQAHDHALAAIVGALGLVTAIWRLRISQGYRADAELDAPAMERAMRRLELNAAATGLMWIVATLGIYPDLRGFADTEYALLTCGSIGIAAFFMPLVGRSFLILTVAQMGAMTVASLFIDGSRAIPIAVIAVLYAIAMTAGARVIVSTTVKSIRRGLELDAANAALQHAMEDANAANRAKSSFLANMSHEVRTPLTAVIGFSEELLDPDHTAEERSHAAATIHRTGKHLLDIINGILDLSKIEADRLAVESVDVALLPLIEEVAALARLQARAKGLKFDVEHVFPFPVAIQTDPLRVRQILLNLIGNATKFTDHGAVTVRTRYDIDTGVVVVSVIDTGIGVSDEQLSRLFQPFGQADVSISRRFGGTGLGLALSRRLAELLGGTLGVRSALGAGSCFELSLPAGAVDSLLSAPAPKQIRPGREETTSAASPEGRVRIAGHVLLAEDNPDNQRLIAGRLRRLGATVEVVGNGERAVEAALARHHDLVLMDTQMPVMNGLTAVRLLRARGYEGPVVALTANVTRDDMQACEEAGCDAFLTKPIDRHHFESTLARILAKNADADPATDDDGPVVSELLADEPEMADLVAKFLSRLPGYCGRLKAAVDSVDFTTIAHCAHDLKSVGGGYGYPSLHALAIELEAAALAHDLSQVSVSTERFYGLAARMRVGGDATAARERLVC
jgi:two-component system, sensor histidine kinase